MLPEQSLSIDIDKKVIYQNPSTDIFVGSGMPTYIASL